MESEVLKDLHQFCKDIGEAGETGKIESHTVLQKYVSRLNSIFRLSGSGQTIADLVKEYVEAGPGKFLATQMYAELGMTTRQDKKAADQSLRRLSEKNLVTECGEQRGCWRPVQNTLERINWREADPDDIIPMKWPLGIEQHFTLYPTNVIILAGEKNSGKTAYCLNTAYMNVNLPYPINYFSSEMAAQELAVRIRMFPNQDVFDRINFYPLNVEAVVDVIDPDAINIVDFLEVEDEFWKIARRIRQMWQKLRKGIVLVAIQKDADARYGRGKAFSAEKARVYITMTKRLNMTLEEIKNFKGDVKPDGKVIPYMFGPNGSILPKPPPPPKPKPAPPQPQ